MLSLYCHRSSLLHRIGPGIKLSLLVALSITLFWVKSPFVLLASFAVIISFYRIAKISFWVVFKQLRALFFIASLIFTVQVLISGASVASAVVFRFFTVMLAASLLTLTTRLSDMTARIEKLLKPFSRWVAIDKVSLAFSLTLRFIPFFIGLVKQVKEAQRVRGMKPTVFSVAFPVVIKVLKLGSEIAEAIEMRSSSFHCFLSSRQMN